MILALWYICSGKTIMILFFVPKVGLIWILSLSLGDMISTGKLIFFPSLILSLSTEFTLTSYLSYFKLCVNQSFLGNHCPLTPSFVSFV